MELNDGLTLGEGALLTDRLADLEISEERANEVAACILGDRTNLYGYMGFDIWLSNLGDTDAPNELGMCTMTDGDAPRDTWGELAGRNS